MPIRREIEAALKHLAPRIPAYEGAAVVDHALDSAGLRKASPGEAAWLSLTAYVRHSLTDYDALLDEGYDQESARFYVLGAMSEILERWGVKRRLPAL